MVFCETFFFYHFSISIICCSCHSIYSLSSKSLTSLEKMSEGSSYSGFFVSVNFLSLLQHSSYGNFLNISTTSILLTIRSSTNMETQKKNSSLSLSLASSSGWRPLYSSQLFKLDCFSTAESVFFIFVEGICQISNSIFLSSSSGI